jgi:hypothetical protein
LNAIFLSIIPFLSENRFVFRASHFDTALERLRHTGGSWHYSTQAEIDWDIISVFILRKANIETPK